MIVSLGRFGRSNGQPAPPLIESGHAQGAVSFRFNDCAMQRLKFMPGDGPRDIGSPRGVGGNLIPEGRMAGEDLLAVIHHGKRKRLSGDRKA